MTEEITLTKDSSVEELNRFCELILSERKETEAAKKIYSEKNEKLDKLEETLVNFLNEKKMKNYNTAGFNFISTERKSIATPKGDDRDAFFKYLQETGHYDALVTVNSRSLMSWYKEEDEKAKSRGEPYAMIPGLAMPTSQATLSIRKAT